MKALHTQGSIYRYKIVRGLANAVFEAMDEATGERVTIHQWTPDLSKCEAVRGEVSRLAYSIDAELCSAGASIFLISRSSRQAQDALEILRHHDLFTGMWLNEPQAPPPLPSSKANGHLPPLTPGPLPPPLPPGYLKRTPP